MKSLVGLILWTAVVFLLCNTSHLHDMLRYHKSQKANDNVLDEKNITSDIVNCTDNMINVLLTKRSNPATLLYTESGHEHTIHPTFNDDNLAPLTRWAQSIIYQNQFVSDCSRHQIMVTDGYPSGFGSEIHVIGAMLGYAIQHNHILVMTPRTCKHFTDPSICTRGCYCLLKPITNCNLSDIPANPTTISINTFKVGSTTSTDNTSLTNSDDFQFTVKHTVPEIFTKALLQRIPNMTPDQIKYWWRAQSAAFIMRFNTETIKAMNRLRGDISKQYFTDNITESRFPLPPNTIAIHIRGGDKSTEMSLVPATIYIDLILKIIINMPLSFSSRTIFISADDDISLNSAREKAEQASLRVSYTNMYRRTGGHTLSAWLETGDNTERFYNHLLQLLISLEADSWIGTRASNWNQLIDQLRCVWVDKCSSMYTEIGDNYEGYHW